MYDIFVTVGFLFGIILSGFFLRIGWELYGELRYLIRVRFRRPAYDAHLDYSPMCDMR